MSGKKENRRRDIGMAARDLGVCRTHLWRVLTGRRVSKRLIARYAAWVDLNRMIQEDSKGAQQ